LLEKGEDFETSPSVEHMIRLESLFAHLGGIKNCDPALGGADNSIGSFIALVLRDYLEFLGLQDESKTHQILQGKLTLFTEFYQMTSKTI
jgi:hypothetical protein